MGWFDGTRMNFRRRLLQRLFIWGAMITRGATLGVRAIVVDKSNNIVLVRHTYVPGWYLPGGGVERGETMLSSLKRELLEEANVRLTGEPELVGIYLNMKTSRQDHVALYLCREWEQDAVPKPNMEIAECRIFPLVDLPEGVTLSTRMRLSEVLQLGSPTPIIPQSAGLFIATTHGVGAMSALKALLRSQGFPLHDAG